jgi:hypothetical protein
MTHSSRATRTEAEECTLTTLSFLRVHADTSVPHNLAQPNSHECAARVPLSLCSEGADYPQDLQQDIWDILFKPKAGASLQIIKIEIGVHAACLRPLPTRGLGLGL